MTSPDIHRDDCAIHQSHGFCDCELGSCTAIKSVPTYELVSCGLGMDRMEQRDDGWGSWVHEIDVRPLLRRIAELEARERASQWDGSEDRKFAVVNGCHCLVARRHGTDWWNVYVYDVGLSNDYAGLAACEFNAIRRAEVVANTRGEWQ